jgi:hypothetical protein
MRSRFSPHRAHRAVAYVMGRTRAASLAVSPLDEVWVAKGARRAGLASWVSACALLGGLLAWSAPALAQREHAFSASFGSAGAGNGQLSQPGALAVNDMTGDVYVIDRGNGRVEEFSSTGAYVGQFDGSVSPTGAFGAVAIAVDNSTSPLDPSAGDVYIADAAHSVVDKFSASGVYISQVIGKPTARFTGEVSDVAVDPGGNLWVRGVGGVTETQTGLLEFNDASTNEFVSEIAMRFPSVLSGGHNTFLGFIGLAIDSTGDLYVGQRELGAHPTSSVVAEFNSAGTILAEEVGGGERATGLAVDRSSNDVYLDNTTSVSSLTSAGLFIERFGSGQMHASEGIAVNSATGTVYTSDAENQVIDVFTSFVVPDVTTGTVSNLRETTVTLDGIVNPDGLPVTACEFEYGTTSAYGLTAPCSASPGSGHSPVDVSANLSGLSGLTGYHFRLKVSNANGSDQGQDRTFFTPVPVTLSEESVSDVSSDSARFSAQVNPGGGDTTFRFEYGPTTSYGQSVPVPEGDLGAGTGTEPVSVHAEGLRPETAYHVRIAVTNALGTVYGPDQTFTTQSVGSVFALPDGRLWEMVSPPAKYGAGIVPLSYEGVVEAAEDGSAITYLANGPIEAGPVGNPSPYLNTQVLSRRGTGGWSSQEIVSPGGAVGRSTRSSSEFMFFTPDLSRGLVEPKAEAPLSPEATERTIYVRDNGTGSYLPLVTAGNVPAGTAFSVSSKEEVNGINGTPDMSHVLLESNVPLTSDAVRGDHNLYEWAVGRLMLVSLLPNGTAASAYLGVYSGDIRHALSNDGSRVFFEVNGALYMRDTVAGKTTQVSAPEAGVSGSPRGAATFQSASVTGSKVFFTSDEPLTVDAKPGPPDLYVYDVVAGKLTDLTANHAGGAGSIEVESVLGASEDGSIVYFVAKDVLASGAEEGKENLYVVSETGSTWSAPRLIAVIAPEGDKRRASKVSPDGRFLEFMSARSLTGYDNRDAVSGQPDEEVFLYDEQDEHLACVSCNPTGARPTGVFDEITGSKERLLADAVYQWEGHWLAADILGWDEITGGEGGHRPYQPRYLSDEGRLFFNSFDSLVPQDTNGRADVYEYEPYHVGSCERSGGCVSLISSGTSSEESAFLDASGKGPGGGEAEDVFFLTKSRLTSQDYDKSFDVYDAHVCSIALPCVTIPLLPPECSSGDSCKAAPSPQPEIFGPAPSATFSGTGNVTASPPGPVVKAKSLTTARKLARALNACHKKKNARKRVVCERQAQRRYGAGSSRRANATRKGNG